MENSLKDFRPPTGEQTQRTLNDKASDKIISGSKGPMAQGEESLEELRMLEKSRISSNKEES